MGLSMSQQAVAKELARRHSAAHRRGKSEPECARLKRAPRGFGTARNAQVSGSRAPGGIREDSLGECLAAQRL